MDGLDSGDGALGERLQLGILGGDGGARVAVGGHEELRVGVEVDEELQALRGLGLGQPGGEGSGLGGVAGRGALEVLGAGVGGGAAGDGPLVGPVAVDVVAEAAAAGGGLAVLAPQAVGGLGVDEAVRVDDGEDVEVVLVDEALDLGVGGVLGQQVVGNVLVGHRADPLAGVNGAVENNGGLGALGAAIDVDARDGVALERAARGNDLGVVGVRCHQVLEELQMVGVRVVRVEPSGVGGSN